MAPEMAGRTPSQSSSSTSQSTQIAHSRPGTADPMRARSENTASRVGRRPLSRASTASIHSTNTQQTQDQNIDGLPQLGSQPGNNASGNNPEDVIMRFGQQLSHPPNGAPLDPKLQDTSHSAISKPDGFPNHAAHGHRLSHNSLPSELQPRGLPGVPTSQFQPMYGNGIENHLQDDNENSETGAKKKKGSSASLASDNELRKLLREYEGYTLKQMAAEVLKNEGSSKGEKAKQVFGMIWVRDNCRRCSGSVRRDRVYCCYAEKCGTERVSVLNPASFGKLVRIIFPNVHTRRLGVRGESKYHYVDLTVVEEKQQNDPPLDPQIQPSSNVALPETKTEDTMPKSLPLPQPPTDTAVFPSPTTSFTPRLPINTSSSDCDCQRLPRSIYESPLTLDNVASHSGKMIHQMLQFPSADDSTVDNESFQLPDIHGYLPANSDEKVAEALSALYRSHCISVIDSFRYCKEKNLLRYFSTFHGTLTVPVQNILTHPNVAPWVKECDWLMYQKMIAFVAPLTTQVVPQLVLDTFYSISQRLTAHIAETFATQPVHMSLARLVPAQTFCNLLRHMLDVNQAANAAAPWLCHPDNRQQMWHDFKTLVDPGDMMVRANIPSCVERTTRQILKNDIRALLTPFNDTDSPANPFFNQPDTEEDVRARQYPVQSSVGDGYNFPDKWVSFILNLPAIFHNHRTQCIIERVDALWDCILRRLTLGGANSFSAWWMTKLFFHEMMVWQAEKGGFMRHTPSSLQSAALGSEQTRLNNYSARQSSHPESDRNQSFVASDEQQTGPKHTPTTSPGAEGSQTRPESESRANSLPNEKQSEHMTSFHAPNNDDSAIDLDDDSMLISVGKYGDMMASDPADAEGDVVVI